MSVDTDKSGLLTVTVCIYCLKQLDSIERNLAGLNSEKAGAVHDLRVAARRCQSIAEVCKPYLPASWSKQACQVLKSLRKACDQVRDNDVLHEWLISLSEPQLITVGLLDALSHSHENALKALSKTLNKKKLKDQIQSLATFFQDQLAKADPGNFRIEDVAAALLTANLARLTVFHHSIDSASTPDAVAKEIHQLRIAGKKFRYCLEMLQPAFVQKSQPLLERFIKFQDSLGTLHDRLRFSAMIQAMAESSILPNTLPEPILTALMNELNRQKLLCWQDFLLLWQDMTASQMNRLILSTISQAGGQ